MTRGTLLLGAGALSAAALPMPVQLGFALLGIGVVGMAHGAGDLAVVSRARRPVFLVAYGLTSLVAMLWWTADPAVALPLFLLASAAHFGVEDAPHGPWYRRTARGVALVAGPAALHVASYAALLRTAGGPSSMLPPWTPLIAAMGAVAAAVVLAEAWRRRDARLALGIAALLILPPLVGFTLGFLLLHALPQTRERRDRLGYGSTTAYLQAVAPVFAGAVLLAGMVAALLWHVEPSGVRGLFAGIAALAMPHLLVTPWFETRVAEPITAARPLPVRQSSHRQPRRILNLKQDWKGLSGPAGTVFSVQRPSADDRRRNRHGITEYSLPACAGCQCGRMDAGD